MSLVAQKNPEIESLKNTIRAYRKDPMKFKTDNLACPPFNKDQAKVFNTFFKVKKLAVSTNNAWGKSFLGAVIALTIPNLYPIDCRGAIFAPTFSQVRDIIFTEMNDIYDLSKEKNGKVMPLGKMKIVRYDVGKKCFVVGRSPKRAAQGAVTPQTIQGMHGKVVFIIIDEACGVEDQIFEQIERIANTAGEVYILLIGNPLNINSYFGRLFNTSEGEGYYKLSYTAFENANMIANGLITLSAIEKEAEKIRVLPEKERLEYYDDKHYVIKESFSLSPGWVMKCFMRWGNSPLFQSMVLGLWVTILENRMITLTRMTELMHGNYVKGGEVRWVSEESQYATWDESLTLCSAFDSGREGKDRTILKVLEGNREWYTKKFSKTYVKDTTDFRGEKLVEDGPYLARQWYNAVYMKKPNRNHIIGIDCTGGFGDTIYDALMNMPEINNNVHITIVRLVYSKNAASTALYANLATEMFVMYANDCNSEDGLLLLPDPDLLNESTDRMVFTEKDNRQRLESKEDFKKRNNGISPDTMDATMMANYLRHIKTSSREEFEDIKNRTKKERKKRVVGRY